MLTYIAPFSYFVHAYTQYVGKDLAIAKVGLHKANLYNGLFAPIFLQPKKGTFDNKLPPP